MLNACIHKRVRSEIYLADTPQRENLRFSSFGSEHYLLLPLMSCVSSILLFRRTSDGKIVILYRIIQYEVFNVHAY